MGFGKFLKKTFLGPMGSPMTGANESSTSTDQTQDSSGYSVNRSNSSSISGGSSLARAMGRTGSQGTSGSTSSVFGADQFSQLYGGALDAASAIDPALATQRNNQLFTGGASIIEQLSGGGAGDDYLTRRLSGDNNDVLNAQIDAVGSDLGRFLNEQLNPAITGSAVASGQLGGGRQGVAQAGAMDTVTREFATQAANLRAADITNRDNAALGLMGAQNARSQTALGSMSALSDIGSGMESLDPYSALAGIFGGPTVMTDSFGQESSFGENMSEEESAQYATSLAEELGISYDEAHAILTQRGKSRGQGDIGNTLSGFGKLGEGIGASMGGGMGMG